MSELVDCINNLSAKDIIKSVAKTANGTPFYLQTYGLGGFCDEYQRIYDDLEGIGTPPGAAVAAAQNTMVCGLVDAGIWAKLDIFYLFAQTTNAGGEALMNWVTTGLYNATAFNAPAFVALEGFSGDGASAYIDSNWNCNSDAINYALNSASMGAYVRTNVAENKYVFGVQDLTPDVTRVNPRLATNVGEWWINNAIKESVAAQMDSRGMYIITRSAANSRTGYRNKAVWGQDAAVSVGVPDGDVFILCQNVVGTGSNLITSRQVSVFFAGSILDLAEVTIATDAIETYMDSNGKGVIP